MNFYRRLFLEPWERLNRGAEEERARHPGFDTRVVVAMIVVALVMVFQEYYGDRPTWDHLFGDHMGHWKYYDLGGYCWWSGSKVFGYLLVPIVVVKALRGKLGDYGFRVRGLRQHLWIYVALFGAILPVVIAASYTAPFRATYPFYKLAARSWIDFAAWEALYAMSFFALEFFFRGFMLFTLERTMGAYAIFVMIVPYCMIHFHKPVAEVVGAIFAGIVLGTLAMVTRSIWCGVLIHVSVAWTMDVLALIHSYGFPGNPRFSPP
jgi:membrane protease YdiL (CAAX protease family)